MILRRCSVELGTCLPATVLFFQSFWYIRTIFIKLFVPEYLSEGIYWISWKGSRY